MLSNVHLVVPCGMDGEYSQSYMLEDRTWLAVSLLKTFLRIAFEKVFVRTQVFQFELHTPVLSTQNKKEHFVFARSYSCEELT